MNCPTPFNYKTYMYKELKYCTNNEQSVHFFFKSNVLKWYTQYLKEISLKASSKV